ncbi:TIGR00730 family Rossman fold protein [Ectobacillus ponti]|uniref:Cytokinin riboside 5'-monophosphate phosphoribohydrolase n=1 Tax=Ectobacillus ponti TaxID=2961894 RepID=A0AA41X251_9BACI|nr:TIGR00730 family Rossman fold protein [Ectobacillus ponti]MCP8967544.1 TIGR00730 family Rossman fold protein [Ectobacillus ponti]
MKRICIFAGSRPGNHPSYERKAAELGRLIAEQGLEIVYGGSRLGLMGAAADAALSHGGKVIGVMPGGLFRKEIAHEGLTEFIEVDSMHERKALMSKLADAYIALPGGFGTFEELFEVLCWAQIGLHQKPIGVLNIEGYYNPVLELILHTAEAEFMPMSQTKLLVSDHEAAGLLEKLISYQFPLS